MPRTTRTINPAWLPRPDAARYLGVSTDTLDRIVDAGDITAYKLPSSRKLYFKVADLDAAMRPAALGNTGRGAA